MSVVSNVNKRLNFRLNKTVGDAQVDVRADITNGNKVTIMKILGKGASWGQFDIGPGKTKAPNNIPGVYFPFRTGLQYDLTTDLTQFAIDNKWSLEITDNGDNKSTLNNALAAPSSVTDGTNTTTTIPFTFTNPNANGTGTEADYNEVWYKAHSSSTWLLFGTVAGNATSGTVTGLTTGTQYDVRVRAVNAYGASAYSNTMVSTTA